MYCNQCGKRFPGPVIVVKTGWETEINVCEKCASDRIDGIVAKLLDHWHFPMIHMFDDKQFQLLNPPEKWEKRVKTLMDILGQEFTLNRFEAVEFSQGYRREVEGITSIHDFLVPT